MNTPAYFILAALLVLIGLAESPPDRSAESRREEAAGVQRQDVENTADSFRRGKRPENQTEEAEKALETTGLAGDFDGDDDVDIADYQAFTICLTYSGPQRSAPPGCSVFDFDDDGEVDLSDARGFMNIFTGAISKLLVEAGDLSPVSASADGYYSGEPQTPGNNALNGVAKQAGFSQDDFWYEWSPTSWPQSSGQVFISHRALPATAFAVLPPLAAGGYEFTLKVTNLVTLESKSDVVILTVVNPLPE